VPNAVKYRLRSLASASATTRLLKLGALIGLFVALTYGQTPASRPQAPTLSIGIELRSDPGQADLKPFMSHLYKVIKQKALESMPKSASQGDQAVVNIQLQIQRDGTMASPAPPKILSSSGKESFDNNAMGAVSKSAPFDHVPDSADVPLVLRLTFYYNVAPPSVR
jgi:TonB family protein